MSCAKITFPGTFVAITAISLGLAAGCGVSTDDEATGNRNSALAGDECDPADANCTPPCAPDDASCVTPCAADDASCTPCDPADTNCPPPPPCDPADANCPPAPNPCAPMAVETAGDCDLFWGYAWNGSACVGMSGCECAGACDGLFEDADKCREAYSGCEPVSPDCNVLGAELAELLSAAQVCNVAAMGPMTCRTFVPSADGCSQPVAAADSEATKLYLDAFETYAFYCPLPDPPCHDPSTLPTACVQGPDVDGLLGGCAIIDDGSAADDGEA